MPSRQEVTSTDTEVRTALAAASAGDLIDLGGERRVLSGSKLTIPAGVKVVNHDFAAGNHTVVELAAGAMLARGRCIRGNTGGTTTSEQSNIVIAGNGARVIDVDVEGAMLANVMLVNGKRDLTVEGGVFLNTSRIQNACMVLAQGGAGQNEKVVVRGVKTHDSYAAPDSILLFNARWCEISWNKIRHLRQLADITLTGWVLDHGTVYRTTDRTDGSTRILRDTGVDLVEAVNVGGSATDPGANQWGISGGQVYVNLGGTDPNTRTMTSGIVGGYGPTIYGQGGIVIEYNTIAYNQIEDCDGFGIYGNGGLLATDAIANKVIGNTMKTVDQTGNQVSYLPFAGIGINGGRDWEIEGNEIDGCAYEGIAIWNNAKGQSSRNIVRAAGNNGFRTRSSGWTHERDEAWAAVASGFNCGTQAGETVIDLEYVECHAETCGGAGLSADNNSGTQLSIVVRGGHYKGNTGHGVALAKCSYSTVDGVKSWNNSGNQIAQTHGSSARILITNFIIPAGASGMTVAGGTDIVVGPGINNASTTKYAITGPTGVTVDQEALSPAPQTLATDAAFTLTPLASPIDTFHTGTLTADRAFTLATTNVFKGCRFRVTRTGGGAFNLTNALKNIATNQWAEFVYDGAAWKLSAFGSL